MLKELQVKNFAIIDDVKIKFEEGLNILTGETGAGKTLIIEAINLLIGERADSSLIRSSEEKLLVQGFFDFRNNQEVINFLRNENIIAEDDPVDDTVVSREVNKKGKNRAFINGIFTQVSTLKKLSSYFIDIHGQHDHQYLLEPKTHIEIVDRMGKEELKNIKDQYRNTLNDYLSKREELLQLEKLQEEKEKTLLDLKYKLNEIENLNIEENEEEELENEAKILKNYEKIYQLSSECQNILKGDNAELSSISDKIAILEKNVLKLAEIDKRFKKYTNEISSINIFIEELSYYLSTYLSNIEYSPDRLEFIQERLYKLSGIKKKYELDLPSILKHSKEIKEEIENLENIEYKLENNRKKFEDIKKDLADKAIKLSSCRKKIIGNFENKVRRELNSLNFKSVNFKAQLNLASGGNGVKINGKNVRLSKNGIDDIEFLISLNPGENIKPLKKIASGGEISRIMLALKSIIGLVDNISIMIFDEIDAGIGGETSRIVGEKLYKISRNHQVVCITHLAQIACFSDCHLFIDKYIEDGKTKITIRKLVEDGKIKEISRMLSGKKESSISIMHAEELLNQCSTAKNNQALKEGSVKIEL